MCWEEEACAGPGLEMGCLLRGDGMVFFFSDGGRGPCALAVPSLSGPAAKAGREHPLLPFFLHLLWVPGAATPSRPERAGSQQGWQGWT